MEVGFYFRLNDFGGFSSSGRAPALQAGGERFDPVNLHHFLVNDGAVAQLVRAPC
jgi:hypothetical protein